MTLSAFDLAADTACATIEIAGSCGPGCLRYRIFGELTIGNRLDDDLLDYQYVSGVRESAADGSCFSLNQPPRGDIDWVRVRRAGEGTLLEFDTLGCSTGGILGGLLTGSHALRVTDLDGTAQDIFLWKGVLLFQNALDFGVRYTCDVVPVEFDAVSLVP